MQPAAERFVQSAIAMPSEARAEFPAESASAREARRFVELALRNGSRDDVLDVATLLVSELVANAILHAHTVIGVRVMLDSAVVRIEVRDGSRRAPNHKRYSSLATTGRGLLLVQELATEWGVDMDDDGKSVWFELDQRVAAR